MAASATLAAVPGSRMPRPLQMAGWIVRPGAIMRRREAAYGDTFRAADRARVAVGHGQRPRGRADDLHARPGGLLRRDGHPAPGARRRTRSCASTAPSTCASAGCCCRRSTASGCSATARSCATRRRGDRAHARRRRRSRCATHTQAITLDVIMRAVFGVTRRARGRARCARRSRGCSTWFGGPLAAARPGDARPGQPARRRRSRRTAIDPVDARAAADHRRAPRAATTSRSATTSSRCCCSPATRTASR